MTLAGEATNNVAQPIVSVTNLFLKTAVAGPMQPASEICFSQAGIEHNIPCQPLRQVLITSVFDLAALGYAPSELRENVTLDDPALHDHPSGTILKIGEALVRLTFHCEPCKIVSRGQSLKPLFHRRGVLGCFQNQGVIRIGDPVTIAPARAEAIPYESTQRIKWYLSKQSRPISASQLLYEVGLPTGYARALPALLRRSPELREDAVYFTSRTSGKRSLRPLPENA